MAKLTLTIVLDDDDLAIVEKEAGTLRTQDLLRVKVTADGRMTEEVAQMAAKMVGTRIADALRERSGVDHG